MFVGGKRSVGIDARFNSVTYNYPKIIAERTADLKLAEGQTLESILVSAVAHEFNVLYLRFGSGWFAAHGAIGGEILAFRKCEEPAEGVADDIGYVRTLSFAPFDIFLSRKVTSARHIGEAWNGHGFEFTFDAPFDKTLIVQSTYTGGKLEDYDDYFDCIRLGIGSYFYDATAFE